LAVYKFKVARVISHGHGTMLHCQVPAFLFLIHPSFSHWAIASLSKKDLQKKVYARLRNVYPNHVVTLDLRIIQNTQHNTHTHTYTHTPISHIHRPRNGLPSENMSFSNCSMRKHRRVPKFVLYMCTIFTLYLLSTSSNNNNNNNSISSLVEYVAGTNWKPPSD